MKRPASRVGVALRERVDAHLSEARATLTAARRWEQGQRTVLDALAPDWTEHTPTAYGHGGGGGETWSRTLAVRDWPPKATAGWLAPLLFDLGGDVQLVQHVDRIPTAQAVKRLRAQRTLQTSVAQARQERGAISDPAEQSNDHAAEVFNLARREWAARGLGVLFVHHDRKGGGDFGEGVAGPNNLVGSTDVLIELRRVKGDPTARRMLVSRRFGDQDVTARLDGVRYVVGPSPVGDEADEAAPPAVPAHLQATLEAVRQAGPAGILRKDVQVVTGAAWATLSRQCRELRELGLIAETGTGGKNDPYRCRLADAPPVAAPPTADPEYVRYLNSQAWAAKRAEILARADGLCEECGASLGPGEAEVHHLSYERVGRELPEDLVALCPGCHRRAHP